MKKRYWAAILAILGSILALVQQWMKEEDSAKAAIPSSSVVFVDSVMRPPFRSLPRVELSCSDDFLNRFLTSSEDGLGYYYGSFLDDVMADQERSTMRCQS